MDVQLVPATEADRAFCKKAHHIAYRDVISSMFAWDEKQQDAYADKDFDECALNIIQYEGHSVGVIGWKEESDQLWFGPIFLLPEYQGKGIGSFLIKQCIDKACALKLPLRLQTLRLNTEAKRLYKKLGFRVLSFCDVYWQMEYAPQESPSC